MHYKQFFKAKNGDHWQTGTLCKECPKFDMLLFIVANQQGLDSFANPTRLSQVLSQAHLQLQSASAETTATNPVEQGPILQTWDCELTRGLYKPRHFPESISSAHTWGKHSEATDTFKHMINKTHNLKYNPNDMVYTDGSGSAAEGGGDVV